MSAPPHAAGPRFGSWLASACARENAREAVRELVEHFAADAGADCFQIVLAQAGHGRLAWRWSLADGAQPSLAASAVPLAGSATERAMQVGEPVPFYAPDGAHDPWLAEVDVHAGFTAPLPGSAGSVGAYLRTPPSRQQAARLCARLPHYAALLWPLLCRERVESASVRATAGMPVSASLNWAHEINNALSAIVLHADLALSMQESRAGDPIAGLLEQICAESIRCANIVRQHAG